MNRKSSSLALTFVFALALTSCAAGKGSIVHRDKPEPVTRPDIATLVVVRPTSYGWGRISDLFLDGQLIGRTKGKSFDMVFVPPGQHYVMAQLENTAVARLRFEPGRIYFLEQSILPGVLKGRTMLHPLSLEEGTAKIHDPECDYRVLDPYAHFGDLSQRDYDHLKGLFETEVMTNPGRHQDTLEYRGFALEGPLPVPCSIPTLAQLRPPVPGPSKGLPCSQNIDCAGNDVCVAGACEQPR
jgi:hypothetical protein